MDYGLADDPARSKFNGEQESRAFFDLLRIREISCQ